MDPIPQTAESKAKRPRKHDALTDLKVRTAKPRAKAFKLFDGKGLYLLVTPQGGKLWRQKYTRPSTGKEAVISHGQFPEISVKDARERRDEARKLIANGIDPQEAKREQRAATADTFEHLARDWHRKQAAVWDEGHATTVMRRMEAGLFPWIGAHPIAAIEPPILLQALRRTEEKSPELAHRLRQYASKVFRFAIASGRATRDPAADVMGALASYKWKKRAAILIPAKVGELMRAIWSYQGQPAVVAALKILPHVVLRQKELRFAAWSEIDFDAAQWNVPGERMKMRRPHVVPLSSTALEILRDLQRFTGRGKLIFPSTTHADRPISENTLGACLRRIGYGPEELTPHGVRAMFATLVSERGYRADVIERQLAHQEADETKAAYHRAEFLPERRRMMEDWSLYLEQLRTGEASKVVPIKARRR